MFRRVPEEERMDMVVDANLFKPIQKLINTALGKIRGAPIGRLGVQRITLRDSFTGSTFEIQNVHPVNLWRYERPDKRTSGLFIGVIRRKPSGTEERYTIQTPAHAQAVTADSIFHLRGLKADSILEVERVLRYASPVQTIDAKAKNVT